MDKISVVYKEASNIASFLDFGDLDFLVFRFLICLYGILSEFESITKAGLNLKFNSKSVIV